jgi:lauroyl/myristoyl acyltransferase
MEVLWSDEGASVRLMERLEAKGLVSIVTDQDPRSRGVQARFLGRPTRAHRGAATLALAADCPVVLATIVRLGNGRRHQIEYSRIDPPSPAGRMEADVAALTQAALDRLSRKILEHPSEYLWAHDRFKEARRPA